MTFDEFGQMSEELYCGSLGLWLLVVVRSRIRDSGYGGFFSCDVESD